MLNNSQPIAHENHYQNLNSPETDPVQYISNHPEIEGLSKQYRGDVACPMTRLVYFTHTRRILTRSSSLSNEIQVHPRCTLLSSIMVSNWTPHAYSIHWQTSTCRLSLFTDDSTPGTLLNREYPCCITFYSVAASKQCVICQTLS
jgi:hypothetical protein